MLIGLGQLDATLLNVTFSRTHSLQGGIVDMQMEDNAFKKKKGANRYWLGD